MNKFFRPIDLGLNPVQGCKMHIAADFVYCLKHVGDTLPKKTGKKDSAAFT